MAISQMAERLSLISFSPPVRVSEISSNHVLWHSHTATTVKARSIAVDEWNVFCKCVAKVFRPQSTAEQSGHIG